MLNQDIAADLKFRAEREDPGFGPSASKELELCRHKYNIAGRRVAEYQRKLDEAYKELVSNAEALGAAIERANRLSLEQRGQA